MFLKSASQGVASGLEASVPELTWAQNIASK